MKKLTLVFVAFLLTFSSYASELYLPFNGISYFFKTSENGTSATLLLDNLEGEEVNFTISNEAGKIFMTKTVIASGKVKEDINFKALPEGKYNFKLQFEDKMMVRDFYITSNKTAVMMNYQLATSNQKFKVSVVKDQLNMIVGSNVKGFVKLSLKADNGDEIYNTKFVAGAKNVKRFDLSELPKGTYFAEMVIDGVAYTDSFSVL
ncbi:MULTISPECIES: hypothetical protein [Flammeovirga]|uniref:Por secretion system C-terminal sorting domain-containing protein n=1 Tax=Flammeovirga agarivorans TaxID=2726742 RepID=A0A7X8XUC2_9BACT|nr:MULTISPECIES: hypothetical protein [Flammeovirga]NLR89975.1 hypothetical protein [Flammeovirga agarivorans]